MTSTLYFSPSKMSHDDLARRFVSKKGRLIYDRITGDLKQRFAASSNQHYLILGPRGVGKSHLMGMLYYEIKKDAFLNSKWLPLWFAEEEYTLTSIRDLMERVVEAIAGEIAPDKKESHITLDSFREKLEEVDNDDEAFELITGFLKDFGARLNQRFVVLFENFNMFLNDIDSKEEKKLRSELMTETSCLFITTAPTFRNYLREVSNPRNALFVLFDVHYLDELSLVECRRLISIQCDRIAGQGKSTNEIAENKLKLIHRIAGGNPRLVLIFYEIAGSFNRLPEVEHAFLELLDRLTPYFQARTEKLSAQQRKILANFARDTINLTPAEIARKTGISTNTATSQIKRLVEMGFLKIVEKVGHKRGTYYELSERLYRYWYQFRTSRGRKLMMGLVEFISQWFSINELVDQQKEWREQFMCTTCRGDKEAIMTRLEYIAESIKHQLPAGVQTKSIIEILWDIPSLTLEKNHGIRRTVKAGFFDTKRASVEIKLDEAEIDKLTGRILFSLGKYAEAASNYKKIIVNEPDNIDANFKYAFCQERTGHPFDFNRSLSKLLRHITDNEEDRFSYWCLFQVADLLRNKEYELAQNVLGVLKEKKNEWKDIGLDVFMKGFLNYLDILVDSFTTNDLSILDRQPREVRDTITEIVVYIKDKQTIGTLECIHDKLPRPKKEDQNRDD